MNVLMYTNLVFGVLGFITGNYGVAIINLFAFFLLYFGVKSDE